MSSPPLSRWGLLLIAVLVGVALLLPELVGAGWHLLHGKSAHYRGWEIPVPTGWFATAQGESLAVERMLRFALWRQAPTAVFLPVHVTSRYTFDRNVWEEEQVKIQASKGYKLSATRDVQVAGESGYCWEFALASDAARLWITCVLPTERLSADFSGERSYAAVFYSILPGITRSPRKT